MRENRPSGSEGGVAMSHSDPYSPSERGEDPGSSWSNLTVGPFVRGRSGLVEGTVRTKDARNDNRYVVRHRRGLIV